MSFRESIGPFIGMSASHNKSKSKQFKLYDKHSTADLKRRAQGNLPHRYKKKFFNTLKEKDLQGKKLSNRQILEVMRKEHGTRFKDKIKNELLSDRQEQSSELTEDQKRRNVAMGNYYRYKEMQEHDDDNNNKPGLANSDRYGGNHVRATARRPGTDSQHHEKTKYHLNDKYRRPV